MRVFVLALSICAMATEVRAQTVGYYDMFAPPPFPVGDPQGHGNPTQVPPITAAGFAPVQITKTTAAQLAGINVFFVQNPNPGLYGTEYTSNVPALMSLQNIQNAVNSGMVLVVHDRFVRNAAGTVGAHTILPGGAGIAFVRDAAATSITANNIDVTDSCTFVANGPHGVLTDADLDSPAVAADLDLSNHGYANISTLPAGAKVLLHAVKADGTVAGAVAFSYPFGSGFVIYSTIPLDRYLAAGPPVLPSLWLSLRNRYAPNILAYAAGLRLPSTTILTVDPAETIYGGMTTLRARLRSASACPLGATVAFSLNGNVVGSAQTDSTGVAVLNLTLPSSIGVGDYPLGVGASLSATGLLKASHASAALKVNRAPATIQFAGGTFVYDGVPHEATGSVTGVFGEPLANPAFTYTDSNNVTSDSPPVDAGAYAITATSAETANYLSAAVSVSTISITIVPAPLTITANDKSRRYGAADPQFDVSYGGFPSTDGPHVLTGTLLLTTTATAASGVGTYPISPSGLSGANYAITFVDGTLAITRVPLRVTADDKERLAGSPNPPLTVTYVGFLNGDTVANLDVQPTVTTAATLATPPGVYPIIVAGALDPNYAIEHVNGSLTVTYEGRMLGDGFVVADGAKHHFNFDVQESLRRGEKAKLKLHFERIDVDTSDEQRGNQKKALSRKPRNDRFDALDVTSVIFSDNAALKPGRRDQPLVDTVAFTGTGLWNGTAATYDAVATDAGEPGRGDTFSITIRVGGIEVARVGGPLDGGNVQSNRLPGGTR